MPKSRSRTSCSDVRAGASVSIGRDSLYCPGIERSWVGLVPVVVLGAEAILDELLDRKRPEMACLVVPLPSGLHINLKGPTNGSFCARRKKLRILVADSSPLAGSVRRSATDRR